MIANETIVLYCVQDKKVIAEVLKGQYYGIPKTIKTYKGSLEDFLKEFEDYEKPD